MKRVIAFLGCFVAVVFFIKALPVLMLFLPPSKGEMLETWETTNTPFKIRVDRHAEKNGGFVPGAYPEHITFFSLSLPDLILGVR